MTLEIYQILLPDSLSLVSFCAARETSHVEGPIIFSRVTSCVGGIPECLRTAQFHRPMTDLPSLPRYEYLHLKFGPNQVNVTVVESHNALPICNSEYAIAVVLAHTSVYPNDFGYLGVVFVLLPL
jgi:hypothetical protein